MHQAYRDHFELVHQADGGIDALRLAGPALPRARGEELPSEGVVTGALQVPPGGQPILLLADHPVTGGYPVIAVFRSADIGLAGQLRPGASLRFAPAGGAQSGQISR